METVHENLLEGILKLNVAMWYSNLSVKGGIKLQRTVNLASEITGTRERIK